MDGGTGRETTLSPQGTATGCPAKESEICDGKDNDCDGVVDNGHVCPPVNDLSAAKPFKGAVFLLGTMVEGRAGKEALKRIWPPGKKPYELFGRESIHRALFKVDSNEFFSSSFSGIFTASGKVVPTPPCGKMARLGGFDEGGTLVYQCGVGAFRGKGKLVVDNVRTIAGVLADGRIICTFHSNAPPAIMDKNGKELSAFDGSGWIGTMTFLPSATTIDGNWATVLFQRTYLKKKEYVVFRLTNKSRWQLLRRVEVDKFFHPYLLVVSDGTIFAPERTEQSGLPDEQIVGLFPDGSRRIIWSENRSPDVKYHGIHLLIQGPRRDLAEETRPARKAVDPGDWIGR